MQEPPPDPTLIAITVSEVKSFIVLVLLSVCAAIYGAWRWLLVRHLARIDDHAARIEELEGSCVQRQELEQVAKRVEDGINRVHSRLDELMSLLIRNGNDK